MAKRIFSTVVIWLFIFAVLWFCRTPGAVALAALISVLTLRELYRLLTAAGNAPFARFGMLFGALITAAPWLEAHFGWASHALLPLATIVLAIRILGERDASLRVPALVSTVFGLVYVALLLQYLVRIATPLPGDTVSADGRILLCIWVVAVAKFCDSGAFLSGLAFGKHFLAPQISPKKTWEGAIGGVAAAMIVGALVAWLGRRELGSFLSPARAALLAAPIAIVAIVSDLVESVIKRHAEIKDSGGAIPGIGGVFDVSDSILLAAPLGYFLLFPGR
jgi:phosphatidate cytidylyltransferase